LSKLSASLLVSACGINNDDSKLKYPAIIMGL
jgi:hypothetical protein